MTVAPLDHSFSTHAKFSKKVTFLAPDTDTYAYQGVRNFAYVLNKYSQPNFSNSIFLNHIIPMVSFYFNAIQYLESTNINGVL